MTWLHEKTEELVIFSGQRVSPSYPERCLYPVPPLLRVGAHRRITSHPISRGYRISSLPSLCFATRHRHAFASPIQPFSPEGFSLIRREASTFVGCEIASREITQQLINTSSADGCAIYRKGIRGDHPKQLMIAHCHIATELNAALQVPISQWARDSASSEADENGTDTHR